MNVINLIITTIIVVPCVFFIKKTNAKMSKKTDVKEHYDISDKYDPDFDYDKAVEQIEDEKDFIKLEKEWLNELNKLNKEIPEYEQMYNNEEDKLDKMRIYAELQKMYDKQYVLSKYSSMFSSINNLDMLKDIFHYGRVLSSKDAEAIKSKHVKNLYTQTDEYKRKSKLLSIWQNIGVFAFTPLFLPLCFGIHYLGQFGLKDFGVAIFMGFAMWGFLAPITLPASFLIGCVFVPLIAEAIIMRGTMSDADKKSSRNHIMAGIAATTISYLDMKHHTKNAKKPDFDK